MTSRVGLVEAGNPDLQEVNLPNLERLGYVLQVVCRSVKPLLLTLAQLGNIGVQLFPPHHSSAPWASSEYIAGILRVTIATAYTSLTAYPLPINLLPLHFNFTMTRINYSTVAVDLVALLLISAFAVSAPVAAASTA